MFRSDMKATQREARRVVADLHAMAKEESDKGTQAGRRAATSLYNAASTVEMAYRIGSFA